MNIKLQISFSVDGKKVKTKTIKHVGPESDVDDTILKEFVSDYMAKIAEHYEASTLEEKHSI